MARNLFITATGGETGKSIVSLGVMELLLRNTGSVAYFRPIIQTGPGRTVADHFSLICGYFSINLPHDRMYAYTFDEARQMISAGRYDELISGIIRKYKQLDEEFDFVLCEGTDFEDETSSFEMDVNSRVASLISSPVIIVARADNREVVAVVNSLKMTREFFADRGCDVIGVIVNRAAEDRCASLPAAIKDESYFRDSFVAVLPESRAVSSPTIADVARHLNATVLFGEDQLDRTVSHFSIGSQHLGNYLWGLPDGLMVITTGDRIDMIFGAILANQSKNFPDVAGIILTVEYQLDNMIVNMLKGVQNIIPVLIVRETLFNTASMLTALRPLITAKDTRKIALALSMFDTHVDSEALAKKIVETETGKVTPKMFEYGLIRRARLDKKHIVLPEGDDDRILRAAEVLLSRDVVSLTILGDTDKIRGRAAGLGIKLDKASLVNPAKSPLLDKYSEAYYELRKERGISREDARGLMTDVSYFGTMMVHMGDADGMVSGAAHSTAHTIRPALQIIKTVPGCPIVSSVFLMCLEDRVLVYGDCAVNPKPTAEELAHIAVSSADTAASFGIEPMVAMLSYSSGSSGTGEEVDRVREAVSIAKTIRPDLKIEGPIQYDAAVSKSVAKSKMPGSEVAGKATVFIFPDLNTGNNTYKAVQRESGAIAIGPVLQGLNKPVNDLSRGCLIPDIINTVVITAIQAGNRGVEK
jgi:phosphate acetyltransferase